MSKVEQLITEHIDIWTSAILAKSTAGRGSNKKYELYGIKKLRELILELAVRGKLVPQDPSDEPASVLLERIAAEKAKLIKEGKVKKSKPLPEIGEDEKPFELPQGWEWVRLGDLIRVTSGNNLPKSKMKEGDIPVFGGNGITGYHSEANVEKPTIVIGRVGYYCGSVHLTPAKAWITDNAFFTIYDEGKLFQDFVVWLLKTINLQVDTSATAQPVISGSKIYSIVIPLPPFNEQKRIVAKTDELMLLCDQLEQQTETSIDAHVTLVEVLLATLTDSADANELAQNWARVSEHFATLFTTEQSIEALKQTLLQLAVMGKLVPQDPNDEPAAVLLEKIAAEKAQLIKDKKIKKEKPLPPIGDDEKPFELPQGWEWCQLDALSLSSEAGWSPQCEPAPREGDNWGVLKISAVTWGKYQPDENKTLPASLEPRPQYEVKAGDFLISRANTAELVARAVVVPSAPPVKLMMSDKIIRFVFSENIFSEYINLANNSSYSRQYYAAVAGGTSSSMKNVSRNQVRALAIALPPHSEQHRIVEKLNELMEICDQLKANLQLSQKTQVQLTDALIDQALG